MEEQSLWMSLGPKGWWGRLGEGLLMVLGRPWSCSKHRSGVNSIEENQSICSRFFTFIFCAQLGIMFFFLGSRGGRPTRSGWEVCDEEFVWKNACWLQNRRQRGSRYIFRNVHKFTDSFTYMIYMIYTHILDGRVSELGGGLSSDLPRSLTKHRAKLRSQVPKKGAGFEVRDIHGDSTRRCFNVVWFGGSMLFFLRPLKIIVQVENEWLWCYER